MVYSSLMMATSDKARLLDERVRLLRRVGEIDEILKAFAVLEKHGVAPNGKANETRSQTKVRAAVQRIADSSPGVPFRLRDVKAALKGKFSNMTIRSALNVLVEEGTILVSRQGSPGKPTEYLIADLFEQSEGTLK